MVRTLLIVIVCSALATAFGCRGTQTPQIFGPGSASYQQSQAQRFDPYPETNVGPNVAGGRPDGYSMPPAEPYRGRANQWSTAPAYGS